MISITVHHHPEQQHSLASTANQRQILLASNESQAERMQHKFKTNCSSTSRAELSSNVEVQYSTQYRAAQVNYHQRSRPARLNSGRCIATIEHVDSNNNCHLPDGVQDHGQPKPADADGTIRRKQEQAQHLHSRSISLIINPQLCTSSSDSAGQLCRRRSLPRLRRARFQLTQTRPANQARDELSGVTANFTCSTGLREETIANGCATNPIDAEPNKEEDLNQRLELSCSVLPDDQHLSSCSTRPHSAPIQLPSRSTSVRMSAQDLDLFRQTGAFLREISDEFSKSRRRTI